MLKIHGPGDAARICIERLVTTMRYGDSRSYCARDFAPAIVNHDGLKTRKTLRLFLIIGGWQLQSIGCSRSLITGRLRP